LRKLTIIGGVTLDVILPRLSSLPTWPTHLEFTPHNLILMREPPILTLGGNGGNAAFVAARCGADVTLHTTLADDPQGELVRGWLKKAGCRVNAIKATATPLNVTAANRQLQRATFFYPGSPFPIPARALNGGHLLVCGWPHPSVEEMIAGFREARKKRAVTALDPGPILGRPWGKSVLRRLFADLGLFLANEHELITLMRAEGLADALSRLRRIFSGHVVIKRGENGALWLPEGLTDANATLVKAPVVRVVNTVGAGDSFNGALMAALSSGLPFPKAIHLACRIAASVVGSPQGVVGLRPQRLARR